VGDGGIGHSGWCGMHVSVEREVVRTVVVRAQDHANMFLIGFYIGGGGSWQNCMR